ncbi:hypothetical protein T265_09826 [Opisthorchis viverrini]|uniref:Hemoglobinase n=1 Tax=Opisthorchis viverrini TaxID=6198 RepID=A0A074ZFG1_OPIVI|nr:hypothetical protein T265_09826 [Opisthorchis viverrini]KER21975.1 hypothetical protein T265_09826 [Opisthorchis viverrini]
MKLQVTLDKMRRFSLLIAFLFCTDRVARLEAAVVHNLSSIFNNQPSKNWVILVAGTNTWESYRHQANVYHAYHIVRANKIPAENIITIAYDDIANNPKNPFKGKVFHDYEHKDVYKGVVIDYRGKDVKPYIFTMVMTGDERLEKEGKKVLKSGPDDNVFIYYTGHGFRNYITFPEGYLTAAQLNDILLHLYKKKKYNKLVFYMDACYSGSMVLDLIPPNVGIYVTTSANEKEESYGVFCTDKQIDVCLATEYSYAWITDSEHSDLKKRTLEQQYQEVKKRTTLSHVMKYGEMVSQKNTRGEIQFYHQSIMKMSAFVDMSLSDLKKRTLEQQYQEVKKRTTLSHVMKYGEMAMGSLPVEKFQGHYDLQMHQNDEAKKVKVVDRKLSSRMHLFSISRRLMGAATEEEHEAAWRNLHRALQLLHVVKDTVADIVRDVMIHHKPMVKRLPRWDELMCFKAVFDQFQTHCFTIQHVPGFAQLSVQLMELCEAGYEVEATIKSLHRVCS